ncbi:DUF892 family protein [Halorussus sp. MSC15.2]|uniref:DUF892 family protein n=1 Tax=Halorussus sp. MSC15.2 TaxID=2283638 RepID=UPI0013D6988B|nr:DUF892 family protein [Halorussus sp. MSC15.2]NEU55608.1 DUF892 family protein [Halorussus sp. MSC15.2]
MVNVETLYDLFVFELQGARYVETELAEAMETLVTQSGIDSLDDRPGSAFRERASELFRNHGDRADERANRLDDAFDALDHTVTTRDRKVPVVEALLEENERFNNVVLDDALRNPFYLDVAIKAEQLVVQCYESALHLADYLDVNSEVVEALEANRDDAQNALTESRDLDSGSEIESLFDRLAEQTPQD